MKTTPQSVRCRAVGRLCQTLIKGWRFTETPYNPYQQKETKLEKVSWRAELCDAGQVHNSSVAGSQELAPPFVRLFASFVIFCFILAGLSLVCASSFAQTPDNVAEREVQRRQTGITQGEAALARGQAAMKAKNYGAAHEEFRTAVMYLPDAVVSGKAHDEAVEGFCKSGVLFGRSANC